MAWSYMMEDSLILAPTSVCRIERSAPGCQWVKVHIPVSKETKRNYFYLGEVQLRVKKVFSCSLSLSLSAFGILEAVLWKPSRENWPWAAITLHICLNNPFLVPVMFVNQFYPLKFNGKFFKI